MDPFSMFNMFMWGGASATPGGYPGFPGGGYPPGVAPGSIPYLYGYSAGHGTMCDQTVGQTGFWPFQQNVDGYVIDSNNNGHYDAGQDGVLAFDLNHDGVVSQKEIDGSNDRLKAFGGNYDLNGDGSVTPCEKFQGKQYQNEMKGMDANHDGKLDTNEIAAGGGRVMVDHNQDGKFSYYEQYSPYAYPSPGFGMGSLGYVDPSSNYASSNHIGVGWTPWDWSPFGYGYAYC